MFSQRLLLSGLLLTPLALFVGCGGGSGLSAPNPMTQAGLGTVIVKTSVADEDIAVSLDKIIRPARNGRAIFYDVSPGKHEIAVSSALSPYSSFATVNAVADKTVSISVSAPEAVFTPSPTPFGF